MANTQQLIIDEIQKLIATYKRQFTFEKAYLIYEAGQNFTTNVIDPLNKFATLEKEYIPTIYEGFVGKIQPANDVYDESGTVSITFLVYNNENYPDAYEVIEDVKINTAGYRTEININDDIYELALASTPITQNQGIFILNGKRVIPLTLTLNYRLFNAESGSNDTFAISKKGENNFYLMPRVGANIGVAGNESPVHNINEEFSKSTVDSATWTQSITFYASNVPQYFKDAKNGIATITDDIYELQIFDKGLLENTLDVVITSMEYQNTKGAPKFYTISLALADDVLQEVV